jgi:hypothetical protein
VNVLAPLIIGCAGIGAFIVVEWKVAKAPMVPLRIFVDRTANTGYFGAFIHGFAAWSSAYYLIIFVCNFPSTESKCWLEQFLGARQDAQFKSAAETMPAGYVLNINFHIKRWLLPSAPVALSAVFIGVLTACILRFQKSTWIAWIFLVTGLGLNALMKPYSNAGVLYPLRIPGAVGAGFLFQLPVYAVQSTIKDEDLGIVTSLVAFFRSMGQAFGVAISGTVFQNQFQRFVNEAVTAGAVPHGYVVTGVQAAGAYDVIGAFPRPVAIAYRYIYADSLRIVWYVVTGVTGMGLLSSLLVRNESMDRGNKSKQAFNDEKKSKGSVVWSDLQRIFAPRWAWGTNGRSSKENKATHSSQYVVVITVVYH